MAEANAVPGGIICVTFQDNTRHKPTTNTMKLRVKFVNNSFVDCVSAVRVAGRVFRLSAPVLPSDAKTLPLLNEVVADSVCRLTLSGPVVESIDVSIKDVSGFFLLDV